MGRIVNAMVSSKELYLIRVSLNTETYNRYWEKSVVLPATASASITEERSI